EFWAGIPGRMGGATGRNAGTKVGESMSAVEAVEVATAEGIGWIERSRLVSSYRHTALPKNGVLTRVRFLLHPGDRVRSQAVMDADLAYRKQTHPLGQPR